MILFTFVHQKSLQGYFYWMRLNPLPIAKRFTAKVTLVHARALLSITIKKISFSQSSLYQMRIIYSLFSGPNLMFRTDRFPFRSKMTVVFRTWNQAVRQLVHTIWQSMFCLWGLHTVCMSKCKISRRNIGKQMRMVYSPQSEDRLPNIIPHTGTDVRMDFHGIAAFS